MATIESLVTAADLLQRREFGRSELGRCELVAGRVLTMTPASFQHGLIAMNIGERLAEWCRHDGRFVVVGGEAGFLLAHNHDTVRAADVALVRRDLAARALEAGGFFEGAPALVVEVLSPTDRPVDVASKTAAWLRAGAESVWNVDPRTQAISIHSGRGRQEFTAAAQLVDAGFPGLGIDVGSLFHIPGQA